jgi:hypothetical protein
LRIHSTEIFDVGDDGLMAVLLGVFRRRLAAETDQAAKSCPARTSLTDLEARLQAVQRTPPNADDA